VKRHYQQLTYEQRCQIYTLKKTGFSQRRIASEIGVSQSTVSRELSRNSGDRGYRYKQAQRKATERRESACKATKMTILMTGLIESKLRLDWSPEQISGWLKIERGISISHEAIYLYIWNDKQSGGTLYRHLRRQGKKYDKRRNGKSTRGHIKNRVGIEDRPKVVEDRSRLGDWEIDTVIGKAHKGVLVTIVERATQKILCAQVANKTEDEVTKATIALLQPYKEHVHTITADNGKEFSGHEKIAKALDAEVYFAHPYSSWERALNENSNGLLRQYFPKGTNLKWVNQAAVRKAVRRLNTRPRKTLGFKTPNQRWLEMAA
jgi:IS30 family transposase